MRSLVHGSNGRLRWGSRRSSAVRKIEYERSAGSLGKGGRVGSEGGAIKVCKISDTKESWASV